MTEAMPDRPSANRRRPKPASDVNVDPIEAPAPRLAPASIAQAPKTVRIPVSTRLDDETIYILNRVKLDEKIKIYEAIEIAVKEKWGNYGKVQ